MGTRNTPQTLRYLLKESITDCLSENLINYPEAIYLNTHPNRLAARLYEFGNSLLRDLSYELQHGQARYRILILQLFAKLAILGYIRVHKNHSR